MNRLLFLCLLSLIFSNCNNESCGEVMNGHVITGFVYKDSRVFDKGYVHRYDFTDDLVPGLSVELIEESSGNILMETVTDSLGNYSFLNLEPGNYQIRFIEPELQYIPVWLNPGFYYTYLSKPNPINEDGIVHLTVDPCQRIYNIDAGFKVCFPSDEDCINSNYCVYLPDPDEIIMLSDFVGCNDNEKTVVVTPIFPQQNYLQGVRTTWNLIEGNVFQQSLLVTGRGTISIGVSIDFLDCSVQKIFPLDLDAPHGRISGKVWLDSLSRDNVITPSRDTDLLGVTVNLLSYDTQEVIASTVTDFFGYTFRNLPVDRYTIQVVNAAPQRKFVLQNAGEDDEDSDVDMDGFSAPILIYECGETITVDAGLTTN